MLYVIAGFIASISTLCWGIFRAFSSKASTVVTVIVHQEAAQHTPPPAIPKVTTVTLNTKPIDRGWVYDGPIPVLDYCEPQWDDTDEEMWEEWELAHFKPERQRIHVALVESPADIWQCGSKGRNTPAWNRSHCSSKAKLQR